LVVGIGEDWIWACNWTSCLESFWVWKKKNVVAEIVIKSKSESKITTKLFFFGSIGETGGVVDCGGVGGFVFWAV